MALEMYCFRSSIVMHFTLIQSKQASSSSNQYKIKDLENDGIARLATEVNSSGLASVATK
jgi:hypothetical protein